MEESLGEKDLEVACLSQRQLVTHASSFLNPSLRARQRCHSLEPVSGSLPFLFLAENPSFRTFSSSSPRRLTLSSMTRRLTFPHGELLPAWEQSLDFVLQLFLLLVRQQESLAVRGPVRLALDVREMQQRVLVSRCVFLVRLGEADEARFLVR